MATTDQRARRNVRISKSGRTVSAFLAINPGFRSALESETGGVVDGREEIPEGERAITERLLEALTPRLTLIEWTSRERGKRGGSLSRLAADLLSVPLTRETRQTHAHKAELRKLEEYSQGKYKNASGARRQRIAALAGGEADNPYTTVSSGGGAATRGARVTLTVRGDWSISADVRKYEKKHTEPERHPSPVHEVLESGGNGFTEAVQAWLEYVTGATVDLDHVYSLNIQATVHSAGLAQRLGLRS